MKIGIEVQRLFREKKFGIELSSLELINSLREIHPDHQYVVFAREGKDRHCLQSSANLKIKTMGGKVFADFEQFLLPIAAGREQVDLLHCTGNTAPYYTPVPIVQTLHDVIFMDPIPAGDTFYQKFGNHYRRKVVPLVTPRSKAVITVSEYEKERIVRRLNIDPARIHVVYNGINHKRFHTSYGISQQNSLRQKYHLPDQFILFLGNQSQRKNPGRVIEAYVRYASANRQPLALVTPGLTEAFIARKLRELGYPYNRELFFTPGYIAEVDLPVLFNASTMFLFPSLSEGFGMPVIEAMAAGTPVITSGISCLPEIAGSAALLVDPYAVDDLARGIEALSENEPLRKTLTAKGLENAKRFSWNLAAETVFGLYEAVVQEAKRPHKVPGFFHRQVFATRD